MADGREVEFALEPQEEGGYHVYAPDLPGLHTQGDSLEQAIDNAREALHLYVEGLHEEGRAIAPGGGAGQRVAKRPIVPVKVKEAIKRIEAEGWELARTGGSHRQYRHPDRPGVVTIAGKPSDTLHPKTWASIITQAGMDQDP